MKDDSLTVKSPVPVTLESEKKQTIKQVLRYLIKKALLILLTIFLGVFITIIIINRPVRLGLGVMKPQLDTAIRTGIQRTIQTYHIEHPYVYNMSKEDRTALFNDLRIELEEESGINEPYLIKNLLWTFNALKFDWGQLATGNATPLPAIAQGRTNFTLNEIIWQYLAMTLLLVATAYLLIFILGLPLALILSQNHNKWYDRLLSIIAPISSVPSWVIGILLITIFAIELKIFPVGGMFDTLPPENKIGYIPILLKHMALPVIAIFLSLFFQMVYSWRTIFVTFGDEDYVDLGKAIGLKPKKLRRNYILKPSLPYVITSFSLILISFWQMTMALEVVFQWRGIGWLYVTVGLPNFWGESMYPGELLIALSLVVLFAYLLGIVVFLLDIVYILVDPRIRLTQNEPTLRVIPTKHKNLFRKKHSPIYYEKVSPLTNKSKTKSISPKVNIHQLIITLQSGTKQLLKGFGKFIVELRKFPSAVFGFAIILLLVLGSLYAVIELPYNKIGNEWGKTILTGKPLAPKLAQPAWINIFRSEDLLSTMILDSEEGGAQRIEKLMDDGTKQITLLYTFDYNYADFPSEMTLYLDGTFEVKKPFASMTWTTPDGRVFNLNGVAVESGVIYDFEEYIPARRIVSKNENWEKWFNFSRISPTPFHYILFADPDSNTPSLVKGTYQLRIDGLTFEEDSDIQAEFVMLGSVYGFSGTDNSRRDLSVPLFWGMPFALIIGLVGSLSTTVLSMIIAATGVWFGGWVDNLIQRLTDINLILPVLAMSVLASAFLGINIWVILSVIVLLNVFGTPTKNFRAAFLQIKDASYIEAARSYGASNGRIIMKYMVPRIIPVLVPQLIILIPSFVFLEATLGLFNINSGLPTWGTVIFQALTKGALYGSKYWVLQPLALLLITGVAFALLGSALERILNPRLLDK